MAEAPPTHPDCVSSPCVTHPNRPVIVWAAGRFLFAFNLETGKFEANRLQHHEEPVRSIDYCPKSDSNAEKTSDSISGCWVVAGDDKQVTILEDETFKVQERFLLGKRPSAIRCVDGGRSLIWADKFGEMFKCSIPQIRAATKRVVQSANKHLEQNRKDKHATRLYRDILEKFSVTENNDSCPKTECPKTECPKTECPKTFDASAQPENNDEAEKNSSEGTELEECLFEPFAGHLAQVTALEISGDRTLLVSGDRDEKVRVGSLANPFVTTGFGLGHTEFITSISCPKSLPSLAASASGDFSVKLWDLSGSLSSSDDVDGCVELSSITLPQLPSCIEFSEEKKSFLVICEGLSGVVELPIIQELTTSKKAPWIFDSANLRTIPLPSAPLAVLPSVLSPNHLVVYASSFPILPPALAPDVSVSPSLPVFYWTDRCGRLHLPISLLSGSPLFPASSSWPGLDTGDAVAAASMRWWKHNREPNAATEEERLRKRVKQQHDGCCAPASAVLSFTPLASA